MSCKHHSWSWLSSSVSMSSSLALTSMIPVLWWGSWSNSICAHVTSSSYNQGCTSGLFEVLCYMESQHNQEDVSIANATCHMHVALINTWSTHYCKKIYATRHAHQCLHKVPTLQHWQTVLWGKLVVELWCSATCNRILLAGLLEMLVSMAIHTLSVFSMLSSLVALFTTFLISSSNLCRLRASRSERFVSSDITNFTYIHA